MIPEFLAIFLVVAPLTRAQDYPLPPPPAAPHLNFTAEHVDYDEGQAMVHLSTNVRVRESTWTLKTEDLWIDTQERSARSPGPLLMDDGVTALYGDSGRYAFEDHRGILYNASAGHGDWRIHARTLQLEPNKALEYYTADYTSCNSNPAHYHFHSTHVTVVPKQYLLSRHTLFYLGPVPIFYIPVMYQSLARDASFDFKVQPGDDRRNGEFLKGTLTLNHTPYFYSKIFLDYYSSQGVGTGAEFNLHKNNDSRGMLTGYQIKEDGHGAQRWALFGNDYQALTSSIAFQARLQAQSDTNFNNDYARSNILPVTSELINNAAIVYRLPRMTTRLSYARDDISVSLNKFTKNTEDYPRLDVNSTSLRWWKLPWLNTLSGFADNQYNQALPFIQRSAGAGWDGTQTMHIARGVTLTPKVDYTQTFYNRYDVSDVYLKPGTYYDVTIGQYTVQNTLQWNHTFIGDLDLIYVFSRQQKMDDPTTNNSAAVDHGVASNLITIEDSFRPTRGVRVRAYSGYDFRVFRDHMVGFRDRVQPMVGELTYTPRPFLSLTARQAYELNQGNDSFLLDAALGDPLKTFIDIGTGYNISSSTAYYTNVSFGWAPASSTWRVVGILRSVTSSPGGISRAHHLNVFDRELIVIKNWHDFVTRLTTTQRSGGVRTVSIFISLKLGRTSGNNAERRDWESEWFPQRKFGSDDGRP